MREDFKQKIITYLSGQPVLKAWIFGSYSREDQTSASDVDILVQFDPDAEVSLLDHIGMQLDLEKVLERTVDLVTEGTLFPWVKPSVDNDKILIYERETA